MSVLKLATLWRFLEIRELAMKELTCRVESLECFQRILYGKQYDVAVWLRSGHTDLARRVNLITLEEATIFTIGWDLALRIYQAREALLKSSNRFGSVVCGGLNVASLFEEEFKAADAASAPYKYVDPNSPPPPPVVYYYYDSGPDSDSD
ncbi:hypothetical protein B0H15DRAFT_820494 [Mycena belliarum]|uniref:Uncharacterized protein n=1 Tax=Mycena belliarum TaxID=1033014 RepID=A0AAD6XVS9_9AGAR|nr:hypothetical protein B0H15DRAFT_820494 [Mycena belliae]